MQILAVVMLRYRCDVICSWMFCHHWSNKLKARSPPTRFGSSFMRSPTISAISCASGDARADHGLVADEPEREADQDRRQGRQPRPLRRVPDGRGRLSPANVPGDFAADRRTTAAAAARLSMQADAHELGGKKPRKWAARVLDKISPWRCDLLWFASLRGVLFGFPPSDNPLGDGRCRGAEPVRLRAQRLAGTAAGAGRYSAVACGLERAAARPRRLGRVHHAAAARTHGGYSAVACGLERAAARPRRLGRVQAPPTSQDTIAKTGFDAHGNPAATPGQKKPFFLDWLLQ